VNAAMNLKMLEISLLDEKLLRFSGRMMLHVVS
jgi:hypothetical protein